MKISYIELLGKQYPLCLSLAASIKMKEAFGDLAKIDNADPKVISTTLDILLEAGQIYCRVAGIECPPPLECSPSDLIDVSDPTALTSIFSAISAGNEREVEAQSKNAETTQGE